MSFALERPRRQLVSQNIRRMLEGLLTNQLNSGLDHALAGLTQAHKTQASEGPLIAAGRHTRPISRVSMRRR
jgi:hypothetical protein